MKHTSIGSFAKRHRLALALAGIVTASAVLLPACVGPELDILPPPPPSTLPPATMTINVTQGGLGTVLVGATRQYTVVVRDQNNVLIPFTTPTWSIVGSAGVATITPAGGLATCLTAGTVTVRAVGPANASGVNLTADESLQCIADPTPVATTMTIIVTSSPLTGAVTVGATRQYAIVVRDQYNVVLTAFTTAAWSFSSTAGIATITPAGGLATCVGVGSVSVKAVGPPNGSGTNLTAGVELQCVAPIPVATTMTIIVTSSPGTGTVLVGATRQYAIVVRDQNSIVLTALTTAAWSIVGSVGIATITPTGGLATCLKAGTVTVNAVGPPNGSGTNLTAGVELQCVAPPVVTTVVVTPPSSNCLLGATVQFTAKAFDASGTEVVGAVSRWLVDNVNVGTANATGLVSCIDVGTTKVRAFAGSGAMAPGGSADLTVSTSSTIASIRVSVFHAFLMLSAGSPRPSIQLSATAFNAGGVQIQNVMFVWGGTTKTASVGASGLVTGLENGGALITASAGGKTGTAAISVGNTGAILATQVIANGVSAEGAILTASTGAAGGGATGITSYNGQGYIPGLSAGTYTVTVALTGYITQTFTGIIVTQGMSTALIPTQIVMIR